MKLRYLCSRHCALVRNDPGEAQRLWEGASVNGRDALYEQQWARAEAFLGTAFEIALVRLDKETDPATRWLTPRQLAQLGRDYGEVLSRRGLHERAEECARRAHDGLLYLSDCKTLNYAERMTAFEMAVEFRERLIALLKLAGSETHARCFDLLARQVARQVAQGLSQ